MAQKRAEFRVVTARHEPVERGVGPVAHLDAQAFNSVFSAFENLLMSQDKSWSRGSDTEGASPVNGVDQTEIDGFWQHNAIQSDIPAGLMPGILAGQIRAESLDNGADISKRDCECRFHRMTAAPDSKPGSLTVHNGSPKIETGNANRDTGGCQSINSDGQGGPVEIFLQGDGNRLQSVGRPVLTGGPDQSTRMPASGGQFAGLGGEPVGGRNSIGMELVQNRSEVGSLLIPGCTQQLGCQRLMFGAFSIHHARGKAGSKIVESNLVPERYGIGQSLETGMGPLPDPLKTLQDKGSVVGVQGYAFRSGGKADVFGEMGKVRPRQSCHPQACVGCLQEQAGETSCAEIGIVAGVIMAIAVEIGMNSGPDRATGIIVNEDDVTGLRCMHRTRIPAPEVKQKNEIVIGSEVRDRIAPGEFGSMANRTACSFGCD